MTRCGIVALAGLPNAGKSTLLNALLGERLAIVSPKPQTTRIPVRGLLTDAETQLVVVDPAGLLDPAYPLQQAMRGAAVAAIADADVVVHVHRLGEWPAPPLERLLEQGGAPARSARRGRGGEGARRGGRLPAARVLAYTQADLVPAARRPSLAPGELAVSAVTGEGLEALRAALRALVPEGPFLHDDADLATQPARFFAAEFIREAVFAELRQELPYAVAVTVDTFHERESGVYIRATLAVERASQKPIVLGHGGRTIKAVGTAARRRIAELLGRPAHLTLWVTVWPGWRSDPARLAQLGLPVPQEAGR